MRQVMPLSKTRLGVLRSRLGHFLGCVHNIVPGLNARKKVRRVAVRESGWKSIGWAHVIKTTRR